MVIDPVRQGLQDTEPASMETLEGNEHTLTPGETDRGHRTGLRAQVLRVLKAMALIAEVPVPVGIRGRGAQGFESLLAFPQIAAWGFAAHPMLTSRWGFPILALVFPLHLPQSEQN